MKQVHIRTHKKKYRENLFFETLDTFILQRIATTLRFQIQDTVLLFTVVFQLKDMADLFGPLLLLDPIHFPISEPCLIIGSVCQIGALLGTSL